ncbi:hypothetical protein FKM82_017484 [Ascaphus truei]
MLHITSYLSKSISSIHVFYLSSYRCIRCYCNIVTGGFICFSGVPANRTITITTAVTRCHTIITSATAVCVYIYILS